MPPTPISRNRSTPTGGPPGRKSKVSSKKPAINLDISNLRIPVLAGPPPVSSPATATVASSTPIPAPQSTPTPVRADPKPQQQQQQPRVEIKRGLGLEHAFVAVPAPVPVKRDRDDGGEDDGDDSGDEKASKRRRDDRGLTPAPQSKGTNTWTGNLEDQMTTFDLRKEISDPVHAFETENKSFTEDTMSNFHTILLELTVWSTHLFSSLESFADARLQSSLKEISEQEKQQEETRLALVDYLNLVETLVTDLGTKK